MSLETTEQRLRRYVREYWLEVWPDLPEPKPSGDDVFSIDVRSDMYANAHVEGDHVANGICKFESALECGERMAAAEFVECG